MDKVILITGASSRLGEAIARCLAGAPVPGGTSSRRPITRTSPR